MQARLVLREDLWCKLEKDNIIFVGYAYYIYIGSHKICEDAINHVKARGLFVEGFDRPMMMRTVNDKLSNVRTTGG